jgi:hypothetical protein
MFKKISMLSLMTALLAIGLNGSANADQGDTSADPLSVCTLSQNREKFDRKPWFVQGIITDLRNKTSQSGRRYQIAQLKDVSGESCWVRLYNQYHRWDETAQPQIARGQNITLLGTYYRRIRVGRHTFEHEIHPGLVYAGNCYTRLTGNGWTWCRR